MEYIRDGRAPLPQNELTSRIMSSNKAKDTKPELIVRKELYKLGLVGYRLHNKKIPGRPDISYNRHKLAIFINGCYWHRCPHCDLPLPKNNTTFWGKKFNANKARDQIKINELIDLGWQSITLWECKLKNDLQKEISKLKDILL
jgi:DNA mismatch endonuclease (patch repair protein)|tara:strand:+ start:330 stop:761 length:432 start_codon:yes stop_codon:yes gene_type:complete